MFSSSLLCNKRSCISLIKSRVMIISLIRIHYSQTWILFLRKYKFHNNSWLLITFKYYPAKIYFLSLFVIVWLNIPGKRQYDRTSCYVIPTHRLRARELWPTIRRDKPSEFMSIDSYCLTSLPTTLRDGSLSSTEHW